ncbi:hypothetical protein [Nocardia farcinica]|uniref:hypothetical protein n=1 Tax=Nocardia farcinica TaxID=37329 RepID=UPI001894042B|nr:hypothetical protein [Nocardia farcinica]MBF6363095.1 hypothetical protein [Nocardia farcinica]
MGEDLGVTGAERRQMEADQQDPRWLAWLSEMDGAVTRFLSETVPDMPENPWSAAGLRRAEATALELFPTPESVELPENRHVADGFFRFVGEVFRRAFEGRWQNVPDYDDEQRSHGFGPVVDRPFSENYLDVIPLLTTAVARRTGQLWASIFGYSLEDYEAWKAAGRPPLDEWVQLRDRD